MEPMVRCSGCKTMLDVHEGYEIEEVLLNPSRFNSTAAQILLKKNLKTEIIYYAEYKGSAIAKAGTNARGIFFNQIGGVYTVPKFRGRGVADNLLRTLMEKIKSDNKQASLFVKKENNAAIKLYIRAGFSYCGNYRISYFH